MISKLQQNGQQTVRTTQAVPKPPMIAFGFVIAQSTGQIKPQGNQNVK
jgi:hypothetical protein